jgi:hypothetical protein
MISVKYLMIRIKAIKQLKEFMAPPSWDIYFQSSNLYITNYHWL